MRWSGIIRELIDDNGIISPLKGQDRIVIPMEYLPKDCRVGDVLKFNISFDPFGTLDFVGKSERENS